MNELVNIIKQFFQNLRCWWTIAPWERGLRVRRGRVVKEVGPGMHLRIPILDSFYVQSARFRLCVMTRQTVSTHDRQPITFTASVGYSIEDVRKLYSTLHHAEDTIRSLAQARLAAYVSRHDAKEITCESVERDVSEALLQELVQYGLGNARVILTDFASSIRTYRVIGDYGSYQTGACLDTEGKTVKA